MTKSRITATPWVEMPDEFNTDTPSRRPHLVALSTPDSEVSAKASRRRFSADYKLRILREIDACTELGQIGAIERREGLYSSLISTWRRQRDQLGSAGLATQKRGRKPDPAARRVADLERQVKRLERKLTHAEALIDLQKKVSALLGITLAGQDEENT